LRSVIESVLAGIVMVDEWGRIKLVNRQAEVIFGYTREELCGQPIEILMPEHLSRDHRRYFEGYLQDPRPRPMAASKDIQGLRKDGRSVDLQVALCPIRQDGGLFVLASVRDITEQKRATDLVKSVVEFSPDGIVMVDHDGRIVLVNQETERIFGYAREEILGQSVGVLIPESARDHHHELCVQFVAERRQRLMGAGLDLYARRKDGSEFPVDISLHSYELIGKGCAVACVRDITEHRRAEAQRAELLRRLVSAQEDERQRIARELHDQMGQYLAALGLATKAIQDFLPDEAPCHAHLQQVHQMTCEMGQLVHRLAWELRPSALDDLGLVTVVSQYAAEWAERNGVALHFHTTGLSPPGLSPELETTVYRIVLEALTNIAKHARVEHVGLILEQREDALSVIIEDDGQGFNVEEQMGPGLTGGRLGLLGMRERAALVAGTLTVESAPGEGTTVFLRIPVPIGRKEDANV